MYNILISVHCTLIAVWLLFKVLHWYMMTTEHVSFSKSSVANTKLQVSVINEILVTTAAKGSFR